MQVVISIFCLPHEIDELERTLHQLKFAAKNTSNNIEWTLDVTMGIDESSIDWKKSSLPKQYFIDKFMKFSAHTDWCMKKFRASTEILGCVSQRRFTSLEYPDADFHIWLDTDIIFDDKTLYYFETFLPTVSKECKYTIVTPEIVKIWDTTWDCLVNEQFIDKSLNYHLTNDPYKDCGVKGNPTLESVVSTIEGQPRFKFAGGWFTCLSGELVRKIGVPESFGHYGYEDTFIMWCAEKLVRTTDTIIKQFKIKNLIVCENYKYRSNAHYVNNISIYDKRDVYKKIAEANFNQEFNKLT